MINKHVRSDINREAFLESAREEMAARELDALILTGGPNLSYFTGVSGMLGSNSGSRPLVYVLPLSGEPILITHRFLSAQVTNGDQPQTTLFYERLSSLPVEQLQDALERRDVIGGRIGVEYGPETTLLVPVGEFNQFVERLPETEFVDAQPLLVELRSQKTAPEVERIERACEITAQAYERTFDSIESGMTGGEIESLFCRKILDCGGQSPWALVTTGSDNYHATSSGGATSPVRAGDMVWIDGGCAVDGYRSDYSRAGVISGPSDRQREAQRLVHEITHETIAAIEPGVSLATVSAQAQRAVEELDVATTAHLSRRAGRIGHSLGLQVTELPSLNAESDWTIQPGMVLTVEPGFATEYGTFHVEENVLVTDSATRILSDDNWRLRSI